MPPWQHPAGGGPIDEPDWTALDARAHALELGLEGPLPSPRRICMIAYHTCPLAAPGGKETGGMNVYVRELMRQLGRRGLVVDCFTRSQSSLVPHIPDTDLGPNVRVIHVTAGDEAPLSKADAWSAVPDFVAGVRAFIASQGARYDLYHSHYWMSGWAARELARRRPAPIVHMFHTLGAMKDLAQGDGATAEIGPRRGVEAERRERDLAAAVRPVERVEPRLAGDERDRVRGAEGGAGHGAGVCVHPARDVERELGAGKRVGRLDEPRDLAARGAGEADAEQTVDDQVVARPGGNRLEQPPVDRVPLRGRCAGLVRQLRRVAREHDVDAVEPALEVDGGLERVAAVVARPREHEHAATASAGELAHALGSGQPGALHQPRVGIGLERGGLERPDAGDEIESGQCGRHRRAGV